MLFYLDKATLPSPCWMVCGAMTRVYQDIGLHRRPPNVHTNIQFESRARLFWIAYIQDKLVSMKMGRPFVLHQEDCDIVYPDTFERGGVGPDLQARDVPLGGLSEDSMEVKESVMFAERALSTVVATATACKIIESTINYKLPMEASRRGNAGKCFHQN
jgi:hypothetical protein